MSRICSVCGSEIPDLYIECPACAEDQANKRFKRKNIAPEDQDKLRFTIRLNEEERATLDKIKEYFDLPNDSTALKISAFQGFRLLQCTFPDDFMKWFCSKDRQRLSDKRFK